MKKRIRVAPILLCLICLLLLLTGCSVKKITEQKLAERQQNTTVKSIALSLPADLTTLDPVAISTPWELEIAGVLYEGLVRFDADTQTILPAVAEKWQVSADGLVYTFQVRNKLIFHSGKDVLAGDIKYSWERAVRTGKNEIVQIFSAVKGLQEFLKGTAPEINGIKVVDDKHLQVTFNAPDPAFLLRLTHPAVSILDSEYVTSQGLNFAQPGTIDEPAKVVGSGPYKMVDWSPGQSIFLEAFPQYYLKHELKSLAFTIEPETDIALAELQRGNIDILQSNEVIPDLLLNKDPVLKGLQKREPRAEITYLGFNVQKAPYRDSAFRQAVNYAINRETIAKKLGIYYGAQGLLPRTILNGSSPLQPYKYDLAAAKRLFSYLNNDPAIALPLPFYYVNEGKNKQIVELLKEQLEQIGLTINPIALATYQELDYGISTGTITFYLNKWLAKTPEAESFLNQMLLSSSPANHSGYSSPAVDEFLNYARVQPLGSKEKNEALLQAERIVMLDSPLITILEAGNYIISSDAATEVPLSSFRVIELAKVKKAEQFQNQ